MPVCVAKRQDKQIPENWVIPDGKPFDWVTAVGAWGDTLGACGNARYLMDASGIDRVGVIHYGFDPGISAFLREQQWVREVIHIAPNSRTEYLQQISLACSGASPERVWSSRLKGSGVDLSCVKHAHVDFGRHTGQPICRWHRANLPRNIKEWASSAIPAICDGLFLLNPFSLNSASLSDHWPHWIPAVRWLLSETPHTYLLVGKDWDPGALGEHERLVSLVDQLPSMMHVLALSELCDGIISTCNSLSMWSVIQGIPATIACNAVMNYPGNYFRMWIDTEPNLLVFQKEPLPNFKTAFLTMRSGGVQGQNASSDASEACRGNRKGS